MSKEIVITVIILIAIIALNFFVSNFIDKRFEHVIAEIEDIKPLIKDEKYDEAKEKLDELYEYWHKNENVLSFFVEHDELEKVVTELTSLDAYLELEDDSAYESLEKMAFIIKHIEEKDDIKLKNIF